MNILILLALVWLAFSLANLLARPIRVGRGKLISRRYAKLSQRYPLITVGVIPCIFAWQLIASLIADPLCIVPLLPFVIMALDDYFTGDDRWKKRFFAFKNKVKWLMELPPEPIPIRVR